MYIVLNKFLASLFPVKSYKTDNDNNIDKKPCYIYKFISNRGVIYVGKTIDSNTRFAHHLDKNWINEVVEVEYVELYNRSDMDIYELYYIDKYKPKYNKICNRESTFSYTLPELKWKKESAKEFFMKFAPFKAIRYFTYQEVNNIPD